MLHIDAECSAGLTHLAPSLVNLLKTDRLFWISCDFVSQICWRRRHAHQAHGPGSSLLHNPSSLTYWWSPSHKHAYTHRLYRSALVSCNSHFQCVQSMSVMSLVSDQIRCPFLPRNAMLARYMLWPHVCPSVCSSQIRVLSRWPSISSSKECCTIAQGH